MSSSGSNCGPQESPIVDERGVLPQVRWPNPLVDHVELGSDSLLYSALAQVSFGEMRLFVDCLDFPEDPTRCVAHLNDSVRLRTVGVVMVWIQVDVTANSEVLDLWVPLEQMGMEVFGIPGYDDVCSSFRRVEAPDVESPFVPAFQRLSHGGSMRTKGRGLDLGIRHEI